MIHSDFSVDVEIPKSIWRPFSPALPTCYYVNHDSKGQDKYFKQKESKFDRKVSFILLSCPLCVSTAFTNPRCKLDQKQLCSQGGPAGIDASFMIYGTNKAQLPFLVVSSQLVFDHFCMCCFSSCWNSVAKLNCSAVLVGLLSLSALLWHYCCWYACCATIWRPVKPKAFGAFNVFA